MLDEFGRWVASGGDFNSTFFTKYMAETPRSGSAKQFGDRLELYSVSVALSTIHDVTRHLTLLDVFLSKMPF
jgi:hypothetical protein